ncbi:kinase-like protein [Lophiostoma macrostomum CBS 122681]|uniref:Kinase-like protein n=1 Tax=Lophiostoma macrostomum CBS 122681 TaxID=1314788 RepID=A0A6A6T9F8_9PLEO|nr:kinase-like protein [Lophiostoma macrostomum CBS 122681]
MTDTEIVHETMQDEKESSSPPQDTVPTANAKKASLSINLGEMGWSSELSLPAPLSTPIEKYDESAPLEVASIISCGSSTTFRTASSLRTYLSAKSWLSLLASVREDLGESASSGSTGSGVLRKLQRDYTANLRLRQLIQPKSVEVDWSGKGQHVTFSTQQQVPLKTMGHLGSSRTASVDKVLCRRIMLARKTMRCTIQWHIEDALREVEHLHRLRHAHIVQLVGTYLLGRNFSILMYPAAEQDLGTFLEDTSDNAFLENTSDNRQRRNAFLCNSQICLLAALSYIHDHTTKHMDIKPGNILVRRTSPSIWRVYMADFGLSRSFADQDQSQTDGPTARTPRYCAPEVYDQGPRGRSADVFSLGAVFVEMLTVASSRHIHAFTDYRQGSGSDESFHGNQLRVSLWLTKLEGRTWHPVIRDMIHRDPAKRPTAVYALRYLEGQFGKNTCCSSGPEPYEAYVPVVDEDGEHH